ncbi:MAG: hypothetical protein AAF152_07090 [Cyanobacteria bacterium P01_A01_bin.114]
MSYLEEQTNSSRSYDWIVIPLVLMVSTFNVWGLSLVVQQMVQSNTDAAEENTAEVSLRTHLMARGEGRNR